MDMIPAIKPSTFTGDPSDTVHEKTYARKDISGVIHRNRLNGLIAALKTLDLPAEGNFADFGCSNGFLAKTMQETVFAGKKWTYWICDYNQNLLRQARERNLPDTEVVYFDLDHPEPVEAVSDVVLSVSTLEHSAGYAQGLTAIYERCKVGGHIVIGLPYENGLPGMVKFLGRGILRKGAYDDFFRYHSPWEYFWRLATNQNLNVFRTRVPRDGYAHHLGWDMPTYLKEMNRQYTPDKCNLLLHSRTPGGCNWLWIYQKTA